MMTTDKKVLALTDDKTISNLENFMGILAEEYHIDEKQRLLWGEIYRNAVSDRLRALELYEDIRLKIEEDAVNHATLGFQATKYIERANKATDQLIKLAEMIDLAAKESQKIDSDDVFAQIVENDK